MSNWLLVAFRAIAVSPEEEAASAPAVIASRNRNMLNCIALTIFLFGLLSMYLTVGSYWGAAVLLGLAFLLGGGLIGFLFGVPKSDAHGSSAGTEGSSGLALTVNTNLEQISDWLTKIIVGVGLVELRQLPPLLHQVVLFAAPLLGGGTAAPAIALCIVLFFSAGGFLWGYIQTRIFLSGLMNVADRALLSAAAKQQIRDTPPATIDSGPVEQTIKSAASDIVKTPLESLTRLDDIVAWAQAQLALQNYDQAANGYRKALLLSPNDPLLHTELGVSLYSLVDVPAGQAIAELLAAESLISPQTERKVVAAIYENLTAAYLYLDPPGGFQSALEYAKKALDTPGSDSAKVYFLIAAARGQQYSWLQKYGDDQARDQARGAAMEAVREAVARDQKMNARLWELADDPNDLDNDLAVFRDDPEFRSLVGKS